MFKLCICPTPFGDFDVIAIGKVAQLKKKFKGSDLVKSKGLGIDVLVITTSDTLKGAYKIIKESL